MLIFTSALFRAAFVIANLFLGVSVFLTIFLLTVLFDFVCFFLVPQWSLQNRPYVVRAKPANGDALGLSSSYPARAGLGKWPSGLN
jgi:hypothetical protein